MCTATARSTSPSRTSASPWSWRFRAWTSSASSMRPSTDDQKAAVEKAKARLEKPLGCSRCRPPPAAPSPKQGRDREPSTHDDDDDHDATRTRQRSDHDHDHEASMAVTTSSTPPMRSTAPTPPELTTITFNYFKLFAGAQELTVNVVTAKGQSKYEVTPRQAHARSWRDHVMQRPRPPTPVRAPTSLRCRASASAGPGRAVLAVDRRTSPCPRASGVLLVGPSGGGKSTFLSLLSGIVAPAGGAARRARHGYRRGCRTPRATASAPSTSASSSRCSTCCPTARSSTTCCCR